ncbi:hypothetical protein TD95_005328 [Thielaviopsis punctulata]|uniref:Striatin N-terminal domain-containing protein n=1 Tax=Thielaviopsis punctulata TaxID=72032 RepID=A0A0F4ZCJ9_9PEZI|nr:hypothetical protein TD95_005328 [Thielaviopsis punctulata]
MGPNTGNAMHGDMGNMAGMRPFATEYTLQGVMRFLQTEWHRHERERNAWEIEKLELKGRIATLEGQARRADVTQSALKKYVGILEKKVKAQAAQLKAEGKIAEDPATSSDNAARRTALIDVKLNGSSKPLNPPNADDEALRNTIRTFLDKCQNEFAYLMNTPANPPAPHDSPPLPLGEAEAEAFNMHMYGGMDNMQQHIQQQQQQQQQQIQQMQQQQQHQQQQQQQQQQQMRQQSSKQHPLLFSGPPPNRPINEAESQSMMRSVPQNNTWMPSRSRNEEEEMSQHQRDGPSDLEKKTAMASSSDDWVFPESSPAPQAAGPPPAPIRSDTDAFPTAESIPKSPEHSVAVLHRGKGSMSRRKSADYDNSLMGAFAKPEIGNFKLRYGLRGHLNTVRTVIFSGGGSPAEPEICTAGDDGLIKRFNVPQLDAITGSGGTDLDVSASFTHRGHSGAVLSLAAWKPSPNFSTGGRAPGDGWIFSGGQDSTIRVWERGRVDPKATIEGHTDAVWTMCVLPGTVGSIFADPTLHGGADRIILVTGGADGVVNVWSVSPPPSAAPAKPSSNNGRQGRTRNNSMSAGSAFPISPQPNMTTFSNGPFYYSLIHTIQRQEENPTPTPTAITPLDPSGGSFVVSYSDSSVLVYDTRTGERVSMCDSQETYDGTSATSINAVVATTQGLDRQSPTNGGEIENVTGATGSRGSSGSGVEGVIITGHEDRFVRFHDANSGQCTYTMWAHPTAVSSLSLSPDGHELVSAGHDASLRFWNLEKRSCTQEITTHRIMRGEGICSVIWSQDGKWVVSGGGDGIVKVFSR